jgi:hypothetical protein
MFNLACVLNGFLRECLGKAREAGFKGDVCREIWIVEKCPRRSKNDVRR